jgi:probable HAF family extracellular repeat protein
MERALVSAVVLWWMATVAWSQSLTWLGILPGYSRSEAYGVSADGSVVVGWVSNAAGHWRAFRWVAGVGMQNLGLLSSESGSWNKESEAYGVSADGGIVVGWSYNDFGRPRALRWTASSKQDLGTLAGNSDLYSSKAYGVSADGRVVVGWSYNAAGNVRAFRWTAAGGMEDLNTTYASLLTNGSVLLAARAISPNAGRYIVGYGYNAATGRYEAFLLDTCASRRNGDTNDDCCVNEADLQAVLFSFGQDGSGLPADVNGDGVIDDSDLLIVLANFGSGCY